MSSGTTELEQRDGENIMSPKFEEKAFVRPTMMKHMSIATLVLQNSAVVLVLRYSRSLPGPKAIPAIVVVLWELMKMVTAFCFLVAQGNIRDMNDKCFWNWRGVCKMLVPAGLYLFQNNILFIAISNLDAGVYQVTYQLKILTTAAFHVVMLKKQQTARQVQALLVLMVGVSLVQLSNSEEKATANSTQNMLVGLTAVLIACVSSGFAGVYFEMVLKTTDTGMWLRNCQLAFWSLGLSPFSFLDSWATIREHGPFYGFNWTTIVIIHLQVLGGFSVAFVVKYADSVAKGFATSISIIISTLFSIFYFDFELTLQFGIGACLVIIATNMYAKGGAKPKISK